MTFDKMNPGENADASCFRVGNFLLYPHRSCIEAREHLGLSHREIELLMWVSSGLTKKQIALRMGVSPSTADTFRRRAYAKLGVGTSAAAVAILSAFLSGTQVESAKLRCAS